jgi:HEAT repeat protein
VRAFSLFLLLPTLCLAAPKPGDEGTPEYRTAADLVRQLGDPKFAVREAAAKKLVEMGATAVAALAAGMKADDEEVRTRATTILPQAEAVGWKRRADSFLADPDKARDTPLLVDWEKLTGKPDAATRALYAEMLRRAGPLLDRVAVDRANASAALAAKSKALLDSVRIKGKQVEVAAGDVAAVLFVQMLLKDQPVRTAGPERNEPLYLLANPSVAAALDGKDTGPTFRRLIVTWIESRPADEHMSSLYFALLAHRHPFPEADPQMIRMATANKSPQIRWVALESLGRSGTKAAVDKLTELLTSTSPMYDDLGGKDSRQEVRDCALAALANGKGKDPVAYELTQEMSANFWFGGEGDGITIRLYGFKSAAARDRGFKKWQEEMGAKK